MIVPACALPHGVNALEGHVGYPPGHEKNPYSSLGLWYYVPLFSPQHFTEAAEAVQIDRRKPYFGLSNPEEYLSDLSKFGDKLDADGQPVLLESGLPAQRSVVGSGYVSLNDVNAVFGWGAHVAAYRGRRWYRDDGSYGDFSSSGLFWFSEFYGKRPDDPVTAGAWDQQGVGYYDFYTPLHRAISIQRTAGGGGSGGFNGRGDNAGQTWAFVGGSPVNGGTGGGYLYGDGFNYYGTEQEYQGVGGSWGAPGNAANQSGTNGGTVGGGINMYTFDTGAGGNSAWAAGGGGQRCQIGSLTVNGYNGVFGSGGGGGMNNNGGGLYYWGDGGGGAGYTADNFGAGVIGGVVNIYIAPGAAGRQGGNGGNGRVYVNWS